MWIQPFLHGFTSPVAFDRLDLKTVPTDHGVYAVLWAGGPTPDFLHPGTGRAGTGYDADGLAGAWIPGEPILYIGRAECKDGIQERLRKYWRFGQGRNSGHSGGRAISQLPWPGNLHVVWKPDADPVCLEYRLIDAFKSSHSGRRPFANRSDGTKPADCP